MNRSKRTPNRTHPGRRIGSVLLGCAALLALAVSPALARSHALVGTWRYTILTSELVGADADEATDLDSLLGLEDAQDEAPPSASGTDNQDTQGATDEGDQGQDGANDNDSQGEDESDAAESGDNGGDSGDSGSDSGSDTSD